MVENVLVGLRVPRGLLTIIEKDVSDSEEFVTRSDWIMTAIRFYAHHREEVGAIQRDSVGGGVRLIPERRRRCKKISRINCANRFLRN